MDREAKKVDGLVYTLHNEMLNLQRKFDKVKQHEKTQQLLTDLSLEMLKIKQRLDNTKEPSGETVNINCNSYIDMKNDPRGADLNKRSILDEVSNNQNSGVNNVFSTYQSNLRPNTSNDVNSTSYYGLNNLYNEKRTNVPRNQSEVRNRSHLSNSYLNQSKEKSRKHKIGVVVSA